jgi:pimeloyl-ACP methyl ester carboxylesterase
MSRLAVLAAANVALAACVDIADDESLGAVTGAVESAGPSSLMDISRVHVSGDVWQHSLLLRVGDTPNAVLRIHRIVRERAPWLPRPTSAGAMFVHGDFSRFSSNFAPVLDDPASEVDGMAVDLAQRGLDVWGFDRRWAVAAPDADLSDFGDMGMVQELDDVGRALAVARAVRLATGSGGDRLHLVGFSRGGFLAYAYAARDAALPPPLRSVKGLVPLDVWAELPPEDTDARAFVCGSAAWEYQQIADGVTDQENSVFIAIGELAASDPDGPSPFFTDPQLTNRDAFLASAGQTYFFFPVTSHYHLAAPFLDGGVVTGLRESPEAVIASWFAHASPHQSMREVADTDAVWCGDGSGPIDVDLARIRVALFYLGAAGGYGDHGLYSTTLVSSTDVTTSVIRRFGPEGAFEDFGHGDILFASDAPDLVWRPLAEWLASH